MQRLMYLENRLNMRLITAEFEILAWLHFNGPTKSRDLSTRTKSSIANFQLILKRMRDDGVIIASPDAHDGRSRLYDLAPAVREEMRALFETDAQSRAVLAAIAFKRQPAPAPTAPADDLAPERSARPA